MSTISGEAGKGRYIIRSKDDGGQLTHFLSDVANDPDVSLLDTIGPVGQEHTAVFEMSHEKALFLAIPRLSAALHLLTKSSPLLEKGNFYICDRLL